MKLRDIHEAIGRVKPRWEGSYLDRLIEPKFRQEIDAVRSKPGHKYVASGTKAYVGRTDAPHEMDRVERISLHDDGGALWLKYIHAHPELHDNPYLPRVLVVPTGGEFAKLKVEKLHSIDTPKIIENSDLMKSLWEMYFGPTYPMPVADRPETITNSVVNTISKICWGTLPEATIKDHNLLEAIRLITKVKREYNRQFDLDPNNMMWRITGTMPQLVITDPIG